MKIVQKTILTVVLDQSQLDQDLLDKVAGRIYNLPYVENVDVKLIAQFQPTEEASQ